MATLPNTTFYWRPVGADDASWTEASGGQFTPGPGAAVEVVSVGRSRARAIVADTAPTASSPIPDQTFAIGASGTIATGAVFAGSNLSFSLSGAPGWASIDPATGTLSWTAPGVETDAGAWTVTAANGAGSAVRTFNAVVSDVAVVPPPHAPAHWWDLSRPDNLTLDVNGGIISVAGAIGTAALTSSDGTRPAFLPAEHRAPAKARFREGAFFAIPAGVSTDKRNCTVIVVGRAINGDDMALFWGINGTSQRSMYVDQNGEIIIQDTNFAGGNLSRTTGLGAPNSSVAYALRGGAAAASYGYAGQMATGGALAAVVVSGGYVGQWNGDARRLYGDLQGIIVYDRELSDPELTAAFAWASEQYGSVADTADTAIIFDGDSITWGAVNENPQENPFSGDISYPVTALAGRTDAIHYNLGKPGQPLNGTNAAAGAVTSALGRCAGYANRVAFGLWGHNDISTGRSGTQLKADLDAWIAAVRASDPGAVIGHGTLIPTDRSDWAAAQHAYAAEFNAYVMDASPSGPDLDFRIDTRAAPGLEPISDAVYHDTPGIGHVHPTPLGYGHLGAKVLEGLVSAGVLSA